MDSFSGKDAGRTFVLRLDPGNDVLDSVNETIRKEKIRDGVVLSGIGTLDFCVLHMVMTTGYPPVEYFKRWKNKPLELASVQGIIADGVPHLHAVVSDHKKAYAGHLEKGCRVLYLAEIVIREFDTLKLARITDSKGIKRQVKAPTVKKNR